MREKHRDHFDVLSNTDITHYNHTSDEHDAYMIFKRPPFSLNPDGSLKMISYNHGVTDSWRNMTPEMQIKFAKAIKCYQQLMESDQFKVPNKIGEGEIAVFDNTRVTHGRESFLENEPRHLEGCYIDWDEIYSKMRFLETSVFRRKLRQHFSC